MNHSFYSKSSMTISIMILLLNLSSSITAQVIQINSTFTSSSQIYPFGSSGTVYGLTVNGNITLNSDTSLVRVIMVDSHFNEYLVYEAYKCITSSSYTIFSNECDETCYSDGFIPYSLIIQVHDASLNIASLVLRNTFDPDGPSMQQRAKIEKELQKVSSIKNYISANKMIWFADTNAISNLPYSKKREVFGVSYNLMGLDYYRGGIFDPTPNSVKQISNSTLVPNWDWRNRHGANDPEKVLYYYNPNGNGWLTSIKDQTLYSCGGLCYIYAPLTTIEAIANLYFNYPYNYDLSEQQILECDGYTNNQCNYGYISNTNTYVKENGVVDEISYPRRIESECISNPPALYKIRTGVSDDIYPATENIKDALINSGPLVCWLESYGNGQNHFMSLIGYGTGSIGDRIDSYPPGNEFIIDANSPYLGTTYWIYKNSWGTEWGAEGYMYHVDLQNNGHPQQVIYYETSIDDILTNNDIINYYDKDKDGYYYWGLQEIPPEGCPLTEKDSDDSESRLGPFDENYYSIPVAPDMVVKEGTNTIHKGGVYSFYDQFMVPEEKKMLTFNIINNGTAQLNLIPNLANATITLSNYNLNDYKLITTNLNTIIPKDGGATSFNIEFTLNAPVTEPKMVTVTIHLNEVDMDDFVFTLVYSDCVYTIVPENITTNTVWNSQGALLKFADVFIKRDATLTVNSLVAFSSGASIYVEQGGTLIIDGGHITSLCSSNWNGIDVWGDINKSQFSAPPTIRQEQGVVKLINGGKISYAINAIETIKYVNMAADYSTTGGVVVIKDGSIENCNLGVKFFPYENFYPDKSKPRSNWSYINNASFFNDITKLNESQIELNGVAGIRIQGSNFKNQFPHNDFNITYGVKSYNSTFSITEISLSPIPTGGFIPSTFQGFEYAIHASAGRLLFGVINIGSAVFTENLKSIYLSAIENPNITKNEFIVRDSNPKFHLTDDYVGLYLNNFTTAFTVEENKFYSNLDYGLLEANKCVGIAVNNSGGSPNELYNNSFDRLTVGIEAIGNNRDITGAGLCIKCNDFSNCKNDIYVRPEVINGVLITGPTIGIAESQGNVVENDPTAPAGNVFSNNCTSNFKNDLCQFLTYSHHNEELINVEPDIYSNLKLNRDPNYYFNKRVCCPSHIGEEINILDSRTTLIYEKDRISSSIDSLKMQIDGGDTPHLISEVLFANPDESLEIYQELRNKDSFLSDTVMKLAIENENAFSNVALKDILVNNPQAAKTLDILNAVSNRQNKMPRNMFEQILEGWNRFGDMEILEKKINYHKRKYNQSLCKIQNYFLSDTLNQCEARDSLVSLWNQHSFFDKKYNIGFNLLLKNDSIGLDSLLQNIYITSNFTIEEDFLHNQYVDYFKILSNKVFNPELDTSKTHVLLSLAQTRSSMPSVYAFNILLNSKLLLYNEPLYFPDNEKKESIFTFDNPNQITRLKIYPNPSIDFIIVEANIDQDASSYYITISDIYNRKLFYQDLPKLNKQNFVQLPRIIPGIYFVNLHSGNRLIESSKLVIK